MGDKRTARYRRQKRYIRGLDNSFILAQLMALADQLQVIVRQEKGDFDGGSCRIEGEKYIFLKKSASDAEKIDILMRELANLDSSDTEIDPAVRDYLDRLRQETDDNVAV